MHVGGVKCAADELSLCGRVWKVTGKSTQADGWLGFSGDEGGNIPPLESCQQGVGKKFGWRKLDWRKLDWRKFDWGNSIGGNLLGLNFVGRNFCSRAVISEAGWELEKPFAHPFRKI